MNTAIIVAAGAGKRFGGETPKQFQELRGKPLLEFTIGRFELCPEVGEIVLVVPADRVESIRLLKRKFSKLQAVVAGGQSRAESVKNGLRAVLNKGVVAVHDGARPLVSVDEISRTINAAGKHGAACLVIRVTDTIKEIDGEEIKGTVDRSTLRRAVTPQCFGYDVLERAFRELDSIASATDECSLVERLGLPIRMVDGSSRNIKITTPEDLVIAEALLDSEEDSAIAKEQT